MGNWTKQNFLKRNSNYQETHEKMLTTLAIKEMQIKTTLKFHLTPVRIAIIKTPPTTDFDKDVGKRNPGTLLVGMQAGKITLEKNLEAS
jgi:hypothetical protein